MNITMLIKDAWNKYNTFLKTGGERIRIPDAPERTVDDYHHPSDFGYCDLKTAYKALGIEPDYPEMLPVNNGPKGWLLEGGTRRAEMLQEALLHAYGIYGSNESGGGVMIEVPLRNEIMRMKGRCDALLMLPGDQKIVIELKDTEGAIYRSIGEPKRQYMYQTLSYMHMCNADMGAIVTMSKWGFNVFEVLQEGDGLYYAFFNDRKYEPFNRKNENWNTGMDITTVADLIVEKQKIREDVADDVVVRPPIVDPLNDDLGFLCVHQAEKPTKTTGKSGTAYANCEYLHRCHRLSPEFETEYDGGYIVIK